MSDNLLGVSKLINANASPVALKDLRLKLLRFRDLLLDTSPDLVMPTSGEIDLFILKTINQRDYSYVYTHEEENVSAKQLGECFLMVYQRMVGIPMAYILGYQEFYGREFAVDERCLIPRSETETLIEMVKKTAHDGWRIFDVGTGSGCIAVTLSLEVVGAEVFANDKFKKPLTVARENNRRLGGKVVEFIEAPTLEGYVPERFADKPFVIVANLPYVSREWKWRSESLKFEPEEALYADKSSGLRKKVSDIYEIERLFLQIAERKNDEYWYAEGYVAIEADVSQLHKLKKIAEEKYGFKHLKTAGYCSLYQI